MAHIQSRVGSRSTAGPRIDRVARIRPRFSQKKRSTTQPKPQTTGRTRSASGTLTRSKASPVPTPTAQPQPRITAAPAPTAPAPIDVAPPAEGAQEELAGAGTEIDIAAIEAAIAAIEAQFGLTREQLLADESEIGRQYRLLIAQANRAREASVEAVLGNALDRGIVRSGIFAKNVTEAEALGAEQVAGLEAGQGAELAAIQTSISQAESAAAQAKLTAAQTRGGQTLTAEELQALIAAGLA